MKQVNVCRKEILSLLIDNRTKHRLDYEKAVAAWRLETIEVLKQNLDILERNSMEETKEVDSKPFHNLDEYDRAIRMLGMSVDENVTIDADEFNCFVLDNWHWKHSWTMSNSKYLSR